MYLYISKLENTKSFYICKSYMKASSTSSMLVYKPETLEQFLIDHGSARDLTLAWAKIGMKIEAEKHKR